MITGILTFNAAASLYATALVSGCWYRNALPEPPPVAGGLLLLVSAWAILYSTTTKVLSTGLG
jgi:hypothetical protein